MTDKNTAKRFYLGIDTGATKTHALIADQDGHVLGAGLSGPGNWEGVGLDGACEAWSQALDQALAAAGLRAGDLCAAGYGLAGLDWPSDEPRLNPVAGRLGVPGPRVLVNDTYVALSAGASEGWGVVVIAGTGGTVAGRNRRGERFRTFGTSFFSGDYAGAGELVRFAMRAASLAYFGRSEPTLLGERIAAQCGAGSFFEMMEGAIRGEIEWPSSRMAPLVFEVAEAGDRVAQEVIRYAGGEMGKNAAAVAQRLGMQGEAFDLVMAGGVFRSSSELLIGSLVEQVRTVAPRVRPVRLQAPPVVGGVFLAMEAAGAAVTPEIRKRASDEAIECLRQVEQAN